jgi:recombination protein RecA
MKRTRIKNEGDSDLGGQIKKHANTKSPKKPKYKGNVELTISTGSTLLDLAITGGRKRGGGLPAGIMVEIFGPESIGKTVLLSEMAGAVQRQGGEALFNDPESRFNKQFAKIFGYELDSKNYFNPNTVTEVFKIIRKWKPENLKVINGIFTDSLAALSTDLEMENEEGDKMGMRRGKEFSEGFRKNARLLKDNNFIMVCSNQIRDTTATMGPKTEPPGGRAIRFYATVRIKLSKPSQNYKLIKKKTIHGKTITKVEGINVEAEIVKNSAWKPFRSAPISILFDYGIDDIRQNLQYIKDYTGSKTYMVNDLNVGNSMDKAIVKVEELNLEKDLREQVIDLWEEIEDKFNSERKPKIR